MRRSYNALIIILAAISIILSMLDINGIISIVQKPYIYVDASIWLVFVFDYFYGLMAAKDKRFYFRTHIWDLLQSSRLMRSSHFSVSTEFSSSFRCSASCLFFDSRV